MTSKSAAPRRSAHIPDFFMEQFSTITMDEEGRPKRRMTADYIAHFADTETKELENPYLIVYHPTRTRLACKI